MIVSSHINKRFQYHGKKDDFYYIWDSQKWAHCCHQKDPKFIKEMEWVRHEAWGGEFLKLRNPLYHVILYVSTSCYIYDWKFVWDVSLRHISTKSVSGTTEWLWWAVEQAGYVNRRNPSPKKILRIGRHWQLKGQTELKRNSKMLMSMWW